LILGAWCIWNHRNHCVFYGASPNLESITLLAVVEMRLRGLFGGLVHCLPSFLVSWEDLKVFFDFPFMVVLRDVSSMFVCWFQPGLISQPTTFFSHNKPAPAGLTNRLIMDDLTI